MSLKIKTRFKELNKTSINENYKKKKNTQDVERIDTIKILSDDLMSSNDSYLNNQNLKMSNKKISGKEIEKEKKTVFKENKNKTIQDENKKSIKYQSNIPQIYETYDSNSRDILETENNIQNEKKSNLFSNIAAIFYIILAIVIILHLHLKEDHIIIKSISSMKLKFVYIIKNIPIFRNLVKTVAITNEKINTFLVSLIKNSNLSRPYLEALQGLNTEFSILFIILIIIFFTGTFLLHIIYEFLNIKSETFNTVKRTNVFVTNKMTLEEYEDKSFTYAELAKLHEDKDYICLKNKRAGQGIDSWNWQVRKFNKKTNDIDICSDIEFSDNDDN
ncbi:conserved protein, unknown function [Hepatocystis sp. ex Piliocolobus tephrosceles]|nr:conserved protein, unknown function [Hepatocystis sp. ex Piliocolobus tephrosceles]VWU50722.1 conserved protein, unknown function [Hepatocystis sp. ex Piliocolobus tephrosceles]